MLQYCFLSQFSLETKVNNILSYTFYFTLANWAGTERTVPNVQELKGFLFKYLFAKQAQANGGSLVES